MSKASVNDSLPIPILCLLTVALFFPDIAHAQGGPPFFTNDPGTPGNANWEINIGSMQTIERGISSYQVPQLDVNFGAGERIQLTCEIPYIVQSVKGQPLQTGWSNALAGVKWRFLDRGEGNWRLSTFPQIETGGSLQKREKGIAGEGPRFYLPLELTKRVGPLDMNLEAGYFFPARGPAERTLGFAAGRTVSPKLELDGEVYDDRVMGSPPHTTTFDLGGPLQAPPRIRAAIHGGTQLQRQCERPARVPRLRGHSDIAEQVRTGAELGAVRLSAEVSASQSQRIFSVMRGNLAVLRK